VPNIRLLNFPVIFSVFALGLLWSAAQFGAALRRRRALVEEARDDFGTVQAASLTLLGLIIGFSFSMAVGRYDLRKNYEEAEANAIGTEYVRAGLLPASDAAGVRAKLKKYLDLRVEFYEARDPADLQRIDSETNQLQAELWSAVERPGLAQPTPVTALAVSGMNDVLNSQGYTQAAWWNRIPVSAWVLMVLIAIACNLLVGYGARSVTMKSTLLFVLPLVIAIAFLLIADIDSPRGGLIHVAPQNLVSLSRSLSGQ
jgi:hypothetical protein